MKELHLICNAHLDPVWQWDWNEGATAALATFYSAAELADEYDYIFCHNEALLYEFIEEYDPALFERIKELVAKGKWHIMGGWYVQPDCNIPSGEGFVRQIETGLKYFKEKFNVRPEVAVNFDSFGHTKGLVQILAKCGYKGYVFCRPMDWIFDLPAMHFTWTGYDGSSVHAARFQDATIYCSGLGTAVDDIKRKMKPWEGEDVAFALWGVGNHGGGASRKDLTQIGEMIEEEKKNGVTILHSTPEAFFENSEPKAVYDQALQPCFVKCYTSISRLKRLYAELENKLLVSEKICAYAAAETDYVYNFDAFEEAQKNMSAVQFHDVLSGTCIIEGEKSSLRKLEYATELLDKEFTKAFFKLGAGYTKAKPGDYPIFVYNPQPYKEEIIFDGDFFLQDGMYSETEAYEFTVLKDGKECPHQIVKESSCINLDRSKRLAIKAELEPLALTRFDVEVRKGPKKFLDRSPVSKFVNKKGTKASFDETKGCLSSYCLNGKEYLKGSAFTPVMYDDNEDPWGWHMKTVGSNLQNLECTKSLRVIEKGDLLTTVESFYTTGKSDVRIAYKIYKDFDYIDVTVNVYWNDPGRGLKLEIPVNSQGRFIGQTAFGIQEYISDQEECSQKFCGMEGEEGIFTVFKDGTYGCSLENGKMYITLLNGSVYCAHPTAVLPIVDPERFNKYIDLGRHEFSFRIEVCPENKLEEKATSYTQKPYALNFYPHNDTTVQRTSPVEITGGSVTLSCFRMVAPECYMIRLINNYKEGCSCKCRVFDGDLDLEFGKYEVKTLIYEKGILTEEKSMLKI